MSTYACAVIAAGSQGRVHAQGYLAAEAAGARLVAVADPDGDAARKLARDLAIPGVYGGYAELLAAEHPDIVSICTPPASHLEVTRAAVAAGVRAIHFGQDDLIFTSPYSRDTSAWEWGVDPAIVACTAAAIADLLDSLREGREPALRSELGVRGAEIIFATYESSRSRRRVRLPLTTVDNALLSGLAQGFWQPVGEQRSTY